MKLHLLAKAAGTDEAGRSRREAIAAYTGLKPCWQHFCTERRG